MSFPPAPLSESVDFLRSVLDCQPSQVAVVDREGRVLYANRAWHRFWQTVGETPMTAISETYTDICNPTLGQCSESTVTVAQKIRSVFDGESPRETLTYVCERGGQRLSKLELEKMTRRLARATDGAGVGIWEYRRHCQHL